MDDYQRLTLEANAFMCHNGIKVTEITPERAVSILEVAPHSLNPYGYLHGGAYFTMADVASGALARADGRAYVTLDCSMHFLRSARRGEIRATARIRHRGHSTCLICVDITGEEGGLLATGEFTFFCLGDAPPMPSTGEDAAPRRS